MLRKGGGEEEEEEEEVVVVVRGEAERWIQRATERERERAKTTSERTVA